MLLRHEWRRNQGRRGYTDDEFGDGAAYCGRASMEIRELERAREGNSFGGELFALRLDVCEEQQEYL
ncbi:hypothetical protein U9M48_008830 [Paspalum notatum var. saurae]|uniref:Uncharacterized protein n=1 Tax=Paspalum notatum var. saurae TaxID=547442 RepID=A0AAQ3SQZ1_PASNO